MQIIPSNITSRGAQTGATMTEYAMLIGLVGVVSIFGLKSLGVSTHQLISGTGKGLETHNTLSILRPLSSNSKTVPKMPGGGYYSFKTDPVSGKVILDIVDGNQGVSINVTSMDGNRNTLGTLMIANKLQYLANTENDPELQAYYAEMARLSYFLGGAEGELDDVPGLDQDISLYNNGQALKDVVDYGKKLGVLMKNPPSGFQNTEAFTKVMPLAVEVYNIAQQYKNSLSEFILPNGTVLSFGSGKNNNSGNGEPGSALINSALTAGNAVSGERINKNYEDVVSYTRMRQLATQVLSDNKVESAPVESTLTDATVVYEQAVKP